MLDARRDAAPTSTPALLSKQEMATHLGVSTVTLDRLTREGRIPYTRVGDCRRYDRDQVRAALDAAAQAPATTTEPARVVPTSTLAGVTRISPRKRAG